MTACTSSNSTIGHKLFSFLERKPENYDVTFAVGPQKTSVKALKVLLKSASAVFEKEFEEKWEESVLKEGDDGIPLPDFDADTFKLFIKLLILDTWSVEALKELNLSPNQLLDLLLICVKYEISTGVQNLKVLLNEFLKNFDSFVQTDEFLALSNPNLETILSSEELPLNENELFECACRWAENKFELETVENKGESIRDALGGVLFQIRFPTMALTDFSKAMRPENILTNEEIVNVFKYIGMNFNDKSKCDVALLRFPTKPRKITSAAKQPLCLSVLSTTKVYHVNSTGAPFVCDGKINVNSLEIDKKIFVYGFGFLGPMNTDAFYDVTVEIKTQVSYVYTSIVSLTGKQEKQLFARKGQPFYFILDTPLLLEPTGGKNWHSVYFSLKGPDTSSIRGVSYWESLIEGGITFKLFWRSNQLSEILFKLDQ